MYFPLRRSCAWDASLAHNPAVSVQFVDWVVGKVQVFRLTCVGLCGGIFDLFLRQHCCGVCAVCCVLCTAWCTLCVYDQHALTMALVLRLESCTRRDTAGGVLNLSTTPTVVMRFLIPPAVAPPHLYRSASPWVPR
ncbi:unnamed protein product [Ectocarpus sp. 4 AP-2014]